MKNNKPYSVQSVRKFDTENGEKNHWTRIGVAFPNKNGGFTLKLDHLPVDLANTSIVVMPPKEDDAE